MRIAMISEHASPLATLAGADAGGQNVHVAALSLALAARGHKVEVYTRRDAPPHEQPERVALGDGVTVVHVCAGPDRPVPKDELYPFMEEFGRWLLDDWRHQGCPDVVHAHYWMSGLAALQACRADDVPFVQTFHALGSVKRRHQGSEDTSPRERVDCERFVASAADVVIATCSDEVRELQLLDVPDEHIRVVPCGVDTELFCGAPQGAERQRLGHGTMLLSVGRLVERKGVETSVRALQHLCEAELLVVGGPSTGQVDDDPEVRRLRGVARELGVARRVHFGGAVPHEQMPQLYRCADIVLATPWYEPFGITPVEAAACGRPVVGSAVGGLLDTVVDGVTGRLVPPRDDHAVARAVQEIINSTEGVDGWGSQAALRAGRLYDWRVVAEQTERALCEAVRRRQRRNRAPAIARETTLSWIRKHRGELTSGMESLQRQSATVGLWGARLAEVLRNDGRLLAAGNGGSAAEAQHLTAELVGRFLDERRPLSAICLSAETSSLTAILNDYGAEEVFARQTEAHGRRGDILMLLSTSGRSPNVLAAAQRARGLGLQVWAVTGPGPNPLARLADEAIVVDAGSTAAVQEVHLAAVHALCAAVDAALQTENESPRRPSGVSVETPHVVEVSA